MTSPLTPLAVEQAAAYDAATVRAVLAAAGGNVTRAASALGVPRRTLDRRINVLGLRKWLTKTYPRSARQPEK